MFIDQYCTSLADNRFSFTREQASQFAKRIANDFNPLHDVDNSRFCVPGDLLFAKILLSEGLYSDMRVTFNGMVTDGVELEICTNEKGHKSIYDLSGKLYLDIERHGACSHDTLMIEQLVRSYVAFSGESFPNVFVPLMKSHGVMINAVKPLVIYDSMTLKMARVDLVNPHLEAAGATLDVNGKRGKVTLNFVYRENGDVVGMGEKTMILSGLRPYDQEAIDIMIKKHSARQHQFAG
ncbi:MULTISPECIES: DUF3581 family protein [Gammaproteobacteria]|uniref:DUF3581 family protein n=1 Tax=Gammaproteobacteria TaxID=1236 RepID=UPI001ADA7097|nr:MULTISPECIES: DUF3581 family protein [Gammaproteobacteria]MBO9483331.1 DUF3581 family protein [Salinisphaera sp. G21_0]MBO9492747.1 DUF3581 family protein [Thalassotalea sp. G20_0]